MCIRLLLIVAVAPGIVRGQKCMAMNIKISTRNMKLMLHMMAALQLITDHCTGKSERANIYS